MAEDIEWLEVQSIPVEDGAGVDADKAEEVVIDLSLLSSMEEKMVSTYRTKSSPFTICRVPENIRKCDHAAYNPTVVSIGPFHRGRKNLQAMEEHKWRYLHEVLTYKPENNLEKFLKGMMPIEMQARNCYYGNIKMSSKDFVEMMVLDGCFVIFFILQKIDFVEFVEKDVLIYDNMLIRHDLLLLENQLPFFVLECLWELIGLPSITLRIGALKSFEHLFFTYKLELKSPEDVIHHLLHLVHLSFEPDSPDSESQITSASGKLSALCLCQRIGKILRFLCPPYLIDGRLRSPTPIQQSLPESELQESPRSSKKSQTPSRQSSPESELQESPRSSKKSQTPSRQSSPESEDYSPQPWDMIPSATELQEAGVRFQLKQARSFFEVGFEQGLMVMPRLEIFDVTNILFRNFIAFEQCFLEWSSRPFTSYCMFIDFLVNTPRDVSILREADIIRNGLGSDEEVALFFNKLCTEIFWSVDGTYLDDLFQQVNQHTQKRWPKWRTKLVRDYFGSPWAIISLIAAVIILILTFLQTSFSVVAYFKPPKP